MARMSDEWEAFCPSQYSVHILLRVSLDEVELRQVDARKWLAFDSPFKLGICQSQIEYFQDVFHLESSTS